VGKPVNIYDAKTHLSELVDQAAAGKEIIIARAGKPVARLVPLESAHAARQPGRWHGMVTIAPDFDAPLPPDIASAFEDDA
jgi:prevent-host-death family protein